MKSQKHNQLDNVSTKIEGQSVNLARLVNFIEHYEIGNKELLLQICHDKRLAELIVNNEELPDALQFIASLSTFLQRG
jgi:hypothetical protein